MSSDTSSQRPLSSIVSSLEKLKRALNGSPLRLEKAIGFVLDITHTVETANANQAACYGLAHYVSQVLITIGRVASRPEGRLPASLERNLPQLEETLKEMHAEILQLAHRPCSENVATTEATLEHIAKLKEKLQQHIMVLEIEGIIDIQLRQLSSNRHFSDIHEAILETAQQEDIEEQGKMLRDYLQSFQECLESHTVRQHFDVLEAVRSTAQETPNLDIQNLLNNVANGLAVEMRILISEVGKLREERRELQYEISELFALMAKFGPRGQFSPKWWKQPDVDERPSTRRRRASARPPAQKETETAPQAPPASREATEHDATDTSTPPPPEVVWKPLSPPPKFARRTDLTPFYEKNDGTSQPTHIRLRHVRTGGVSSEDQAGTEEPWQDKAQAAFAAFFDNVSKETKQGEAIGEGFDLSSLTSSHLGNEDMDLIDEAQEEELDRRLLELQREEDEYARLEEDRKREAEKQARAQAEAKRLEEENQNRRRAKAARLKELERKRVLRETHDEDPPDKSL